MSTIALVSTTFADVGEAERIGSALVAERFAACVTIHPAARSIYRWNDAIERAQEVPATFKTSSVRARKLCAEILRRHSYELPVIETGSVEVEADVAAWVQASTC